MAAPQTDMGVVVGGVQGCNSSTMSSQELVRGTRLTASKKLCDKQGIAVKPQCLDCA